MKDLKSYIINEAADKSLFEFFAFSKRHNLVCRGLSRKDIEVLNVNKINRRYEKVLSECPAITNLEITFQDKCATEIMTRMIRCILYDVDWKKNIDLIYDQVEDCIYTFLKSETADTKIKKADYLGVECGRKYCVAFTIGDGDSVFALMWD